VRRERKSASWLPALFPLLGSQCCPLSSRSLSQIPICCLSRSGTAIARSASSKMAASGFSQRTARVSPNGFPICNAIIFTNSADQLRAALEALIKKWQLRLQCQSTPKTLCFPKNGERLVTTTHREATANRASIKAGL
jgi:hypothetical protein